MTIDITKITPEKLAEMNDSLMVDNNHLRGQLEHWKAKWDHEALESESLRQQLAAALAACKAKDEALQQIADDDYDGSPINIAHKALAIQKLADSRKQVTLLRDVLAHIQRCIPIGGFAQIHWDSATWVQIDEALAATADLGGLILCHAEPDSYKYKHHDSFGVGFFWSHRPTHQGSAALESVPLYRAWEPKP